jgi:hypothetical protein
VRAAAQPRHAAAFDPWNSSSTGHQRAENRLGASTGWRDSRGRKLQAQFRGGASGGARVHDTVGAGALGYDAKTGVLVTPEARARARSSVADMLVRPGSMRKTMEAAAGAGTATGVRGSSCLSASSSSSLRGPAWPTASANNDSSTSGRSSATVSTMDKESGHGSLTGEDRLVARRRADGRADEQDDEQDDVVKSTGPRGIFHGVVVYVNGSTHPVISDHRLKHVLAEHGARMSAHLGRRQVTHVILGRPTGGGRGAGGGLAGGKLQREIQRVGGCGVKFVDVEW